MGEAEDVDLLEGGARLRGQRQQPRPVVRQLRVVQREGQLQRLLDLPLLPPGKEPENLDIMGDRCTPSRGTMDMEDAKGSCVMPKALGRLHDHNSMAQRVK